MAVYPVFELAASALKIRWEEPYVSEALNRKFSAMVPEGVYYGFECSVDLMNSMLLHIDVDPNRAESIGVIEQDTDLRSVFCRLDANVTLDFTGHTVFPVLVVLESDYQVGVPTAGRIKVVDDLGDNQIILCRVFAGLVLDTSPRMVAPVVGNLYRPYPSRPCNDKLNVRPGHHIKSDRSGVVRLVGPSVTPAFAVNSLAAKVRYDLVSVTDAGALLVTPGVEFPAAGITAATTHGPVPPLAAVSVAYVRITEGPGDPICIDDEDITDVREWFNLGIPLGGIQEGMDTKDEGGIIKLGAKKYNFVGPGVVAAVDAFDTDQVNITIVGGGGGGGGGGGTGCRVSPPGYIHGFMLESHPADPLNKVRATRGIARNDDDDGDIIEEVLFLEADINLLGAGGLDAGVMVPDTFYYIWLIQNITVPATPVNALIFSLSPVLPALPAGYTKQRRIGSCKTHPVSLSCPTGIMRFRQIGDDQERETYYMETVSCTSSYALPGGWSSACLRTAFIAGEVSLGTGGSAAMSLVDFVPTTSKRALVNFLYDAAPFGALLLRIPGEINFQYKIDHRDTSGTTWSTWQDWVLLDGTRVLEAVGGNGPVKLAAGIVVGYMEDLRTEVVREDICGGGGGSGECVEVFDDGVSQGFFESCGGGGGGGGNCELALYDEASLVGTFVCAGGGGGGGGGGPCIGKTILPVAPTLIAQHHGSGPGVSFGAQVLFSAASIVRPPGATHAIVRSLIDVKKNGPGALAVSVWLSKYNPVPSSLAPVYGPGYYADPEFVNQAAVQAADTDDSDTDSTLHFVELDPIANPLGDLTYYLDNLFGGTAESQFYLYIEGFLIDEPSCGGGGGGNNCGHLHGFVAAGGGASVSLTPGCARNSDDDGDISSIVPLPIATGVVGVGGLDIGPISDGFWYIWVIKNSTSSAVGAVLSLSSTAPSMPAGFDKKRRVGSVNIVGGSILRFRQHGNGSTRQTVYLDAVLCESGCGGFFPGCYSTAFFVGLIYPLGATVFSLASYVPPTSGRALCVTYYDSLPCGAATLRIPGDPGYQVKIEHADPSNVTADSQSYWITLDSTRTMEAVGWIGFSWVDSYVSTYEEEL